MGLVLSSFFYGYIFTQILGGWLATKWGGHRVFCAGITATALLTLVTPPLTKVNFYLLLALRIIEGLFEVRIHSKKIFFPWDSIRDLYLSCASPQGVTFPCIHAVWSKWAPPLERSKLATIGFSGSFVGTVVSMPLCGLIANTLGWEAIFYIFG